MYYYYYVVCILGGVKATILHPSLFKSAPQLFKFDVPIASVSIGPHILLLAFQIHKIEAALEYVIVDLKPPNVCTCSSGRMKKLLLPLCFCLCR